MPSTSVQISMRSASKSRAENRGGKIGAATADGGGDSSAVCANESPHRLELLPASSRGFTFSSSRELVSS